MKKINIVLATSLSIVSLAWADVTEQQPNISQQQLSKRPYANVPVQKDATHEQTNTKAEKNYKTLQLHMLGKRPYAEKSKD